MHDDPFARAVERARETERAEAEAKRRHVQREVGSVVSHGARTAFRTHVSVFIAVNLLLLIIWATTTPGGYPWFLYPLFGWGIGVVAHWSATSGLMRGGGGGRDRSRDHDRNRPQAAMPASPPPAPTPVPEAPTTMPMPQGGNTSEELGRLAELHARGVLSDKEFKAAKAKLLG